jgi:ABC-type nitrate/sulfonate/bicarbonate transport system substrate-binding protein
VALAALAAGIAAARAEPVKLRIGWIVPANDSPFFMFKTEGIAQHAGASYTLDFLHFQSTPLMVTALATGETDLTELSYPAIKGDRVVFNVKGNEYRVVVAMDYGRRAVFIKFVGTHAEHDKIEPETVSRY